MTSSSGFIVPEQVAQSGSTIPDTITSIEGVLSTSSSFPRALMKLRTSRSSMDPLRSFGVCSRMVGHTRAVMSPLDETPAEIMLAILRMASVRPQTSLRTRALTPQLPPDDLLRAIRVCKRWHRMGEALLYRDLSCSTALGGCRRCLKLSAGRDVDELHRLRLLHALLRPQFATQIRRLTFTDTYSFCACAKPRPVSTSSHSTHFATLFIETVTALLSNAERLQSLRSRAHPL